VNGQKSAEAIVVVKVFAAKGRTGKDKEEL
jgi:hypothetical protein